MSRLLWDKNSMIVSVVGHLQDFSLAVLHAGDQLGKSTNGSIRLSLCSILIKARTATSGKVEKKNSETNINAKCDKLKCIYSVIFFSDFIKHEQLGHMNTNSF